MVHACLHGEVKRLVTWGDTRPDNLLKVRKDGQEIHHTPAYPAGQAVIEDLPSSFSWHTAWIWAETGNLLALTNPIFLDYILEPSRGKGVVGFDDTGPPK
jgi:hypothetical protein